MKAKAICIVSLLVFSSLLFSSCQKEAMDVQSSTQTVLNEDLSLSDIQIVIQVSPNVLNILNNGTVVTIHTSIPYSQVLGATVSLNGLQIQSWKADNQGYFVAKFNMNAVKNLPGLVIGGYNMLTLNGTTSNNLTFEGSQSILVLSNTPSGSSRN